MPLGVREVLVTIRARDVLSRTLQTIGTNFNALERQQMSFQQRMFSTGAAFTAVGAGIGAIGAVGVAFFNRATDAAIEYNKKAAFTLTQTQGLGATLEQIADIGKRVASQIPAPFEQMQDALYDIFSSTEANVQQAEQLLALFAKGAVAGQTDVRTAARATISVMNAYKLPFTEANNVMDTMFNMVRFGVGTYEEFNQAIGRAIPAAVSASQSFDTLGAVMIFLTRAGLSTQMAATSAARAFELFSKPDVVQALRDIGVEVVDQSGNFKQMDVILRELAGSKGWAELGSAERKKLFQEIFGQGTIQARRFFDIAIPNFQDLITYAGRTADSAGALGTAYGTMFETPAMQAQLLANRYEVLRVEIGEKLIPVKLRLIEILGKVLDWWNSLSEGTQTLIVRIAASAAAFMTIGGIALVLVGTFMLLAGAIGSVGLAFGILLGVPVIIAGIAAAIFLLAKNWDKVVSFMQSKWVLLIPGIGAVIFVIMRIVDAVRWVIKNWDDLVKTAQDVWGRIKEIAGSVWDVITEKAKEAWAILREFGGWIGSVLTTAWDAVKGAWETAIGGLSTAWDSVVDAFQAAWDWLSNNFGPGVKKVWDALVDAWNGVTSEIKETIDAFRRYWEAFWSVFGGPIKLAGQVIKTQFDMWVGWFKITFDVIAFFVRTGMDIVLSIVRFVMEMIGNQIKATLDFVINMWGPTWDFIKSTFQVIWNLMSTVVTNAVDVITSVIENGLNFIKSVWQPIWNFVQTYLVSTWNIMTTLVSTAITVISNIIQVIMNLIQGDWGEAWQNILNILKAIWDLIKTTVTSIWNIIYSYISTGLQVLKALWSLAWNVIKDALVAVWNIIKGVVQAAVDFIRNLIKLGTDAIRTAWNAAWEFVKTTASNAWDWVKSRATAFKDNIVSTFNALKDAMANIWRSIRDTAKNIWEGVKTAIKNAINGVIALVNKLIGGINTILGLIPGLDLKIPTIPRLESGGTLPMGAGMPIGAHMPTMATGGRIGGGFLTNKPMAIVGEGKTNYPEYVIPTDPKHRRNAFTLYDQLGNMLGTAPGLQFGGLVDAFKKGVSWGGDLVKKGAEAIGGLARTALTAAFDPIVRGVIKGLDKLPNVFYLPKIAKGIANAIWDWVKGADSALPKEVAGGAVGRSASFGGLQPAFARDVKALIARSGGQIYLISGWRSSQKQAQLYAQYAARGFTGAPVAKPGTSYHEKGLAADLSRPYGLLSRLAHSFGMKSPVRGEPWHWQPGWTTNRNYYARGGILGYAKGAWKIVQDQLAILHRGEMVMPKGVSDQIRGESAGGILGLQRGGILGGIFGKRGVLNPAKYIPELKFLTGVYKWMSHGKSDVYKRRLTNRIFMAFFKRIIADATKTLGALGKLPYGKRMATDMASSIWRQIKGPDIGVQPPTPLGSLIDMLTKTPGGLSIMGGRPRTPPSPPTAGDRSGVQFVFNGNVTFGSDMYAATSDLDFFARARMAGV